MAPSEVIDFWFAEISPAQRFKKDAAIDELIVERFAVLHRRASQCELYPWRSTPLGALAEILVLDQFSRNMYRERPESFATDSLALALAQELVSRGQDKDLSVTQRAFAYMPYMHSESAEIHEQAEQLFAQPGLEEQHRFEIRHREIIDRFGRYPHRNAVLGRTSTDEELKFLKEPGSSF